MRNANWIRQLLILAIPAILYGCGTPKPLMYKELYSTAYLRSDTNDASMTMPYSYSSQTNLRIYDKIIVDNVTIYRGPDNQFGKMSEDDKTALATYMYSQFVEKLTSRFTITYSPGSNTLRLKLILTGAATTTPVLGTLSRFDLSGGLYNGIQSIRGGEGTFTGSVLYAVEIYDAATSQLLRAYIAKEYPNSLNIGASFGALAAARTGIEKGAEKLVEQLQ